MFIRTLSTTKNQRHKAVRKQSYSKKHFGEVSETPLRDELVKQQQKLANQTFLEEQIDTVEYGHEAREQQDKEPGRIRIRVRGQLYETLDANLQMFPTTLLGNPLERTRFYNEVSDEYVFNR